MSSVSYLISIQPEIRKIYDDYNSYSNKFLLEWNELWPAYQQDVALNYNRIINMPMMSSEKVYYSILTNLITVALNAIPSVNPQFSRLHNLILVIKQFDSSVVKRTPAIIKTHFLAGKVFVIAEQINAMKEYSKILQLMQIILKLLSRSSSRQLNFSRKIKLYFKNYSYDSPVTRPDSSPA